MPVTKNYKTPCRILPSDTSIVRTVTLHYIAVFYSGQGNSKKTARNHYGAVTLSGYKFRNR